MAATTIFDATIKAVDEASGPLKAIAERVRGLGITSERVGAHFRGLALVSHAAFGGVEHDEKKAAAGMEHLGAPAAYKAVTQHLAILRQHFGRVGESIGGVIAKMTQLLPMLGGIGGVGSVAGIVEMVHSASESASVLATSATQAGMTARQFANLSFAGQMVDVSAQNMQMALFRLNERLGQAASGHNKNVAGMLAHLGIALKDAKGHTLSAAEVLPQLADAFAKTHDQALRAQMMMMLFGRTGSQLMPLFAGGAEKMKELQAIAAQDVFVPNAHQMKGLEAFKLAWMKTTAAAQSFQDEIGTKLAPVLTPIVNQFSQWVNQNRDFVASGIASAVRDVGRWLGQIDVGAVVRQFRTWTGEIGAVVADLGGLKTVALALGAILAVGLIVKVVQAARALAEIGAAARVVLAAIGVSTPFGLALVALAGAGLLIYRNWSPIQAFFERMWAGVTKAFEKAWERIRPIIEAIRHGAEEISRALGFNKGDLAPVKGPDGARGYYTPLPHGGRLFHPLQTTAPPGLGGRLNLPQQQGHVTVDINLHGAPPGTQVRAGSDGLAAPPRIHLGVNVPAGHGAAYGSGMDLARLGGR